MAPQSRNAMPRPPEKGIYGTARELIGRNNEKKRTTKMVVLFSDEEGGLAFAILVFKGQSIRLTNAVEHGVDRNCDSPVVQDGFLAGSALEPASHFGRRL